MRKLLTFFCVLLLAFPLVAQQNRGNIIGKVVDEDGNPIPGVTVTLTGSLTAPVTAVTSAEGVFRFMALAPENDYAIKCELEGFKPLIRTDIVVAVGRNTELTLTMEMGALEEEITVTAASPVVQSKKTTVAETVTQEMLQSLPTARDPWVVLQQAPGIMVDRENIGGSESGQQAGFIAKGGGYDQWSMDGVVITDPAAIASPTYYDFDAFEEMNITTGGADVTIQGGGVALNLVTRRGGNRVSLGGRFYFTDSKFQAAHTGPKVDEILARYPKGVGYNVIRNIKDYGFNMGGPLWVDKAWWWMSYGVQDIKTNVITGAADDTLLQNYAGKINLQLLPENRFEAFTHIGNKEKFGRSSSHSFPRGWHQTGKYHFGSPIYKIQDEHMFGDNLFLSAKWSFNDAGFNLIPMDDEEQNKLTRRDIDNGVYYDSYYAYNASRPSHSIYLQANYFNDDLFGASHEFKVGFDWRHSTGQHYWSTSGNVMTAYNYGNRLILDMDGDGLPDVVPGIKAVWVWRGWRDNNSVTQYAGYFQDTITIGRLNLILGFRLDYQTPKISAFEKTAVEPDNGAWKDNFTPAAINAIKGFLPGLKIPAIESNWGYTTFSPRIGLTYDLFGDGKTIAKLNFARYGEFMSTGWADYFLPTYTGGWVDFWWMDNGDNIVDVTELYWRYLGSYTPHQVFDSSGNIIADVPAAEWEMWGSFDPTNPQQTGEKAYTLDDSVGSYYITEYIATIERELLPDFGAALDFTYRRFTNYNWDLAWDGKDKNTIRSQDD
ncbi:MAG: carboxypeptidase regulatory-like domain-containing protein, partial [Candidatus Aminicenantales bacterium]